MKKSIIICFLLCLSFAPAFSQINDNCIDAIPLCSTPSFTFNANSGPGSIIDFSTSSNISNPSTNPNPPNSGCLLSGELNPQWLLITIGNAGLLEFVFGAANSLHPQAGCYDWAMWPYSPTTCADILNNTLPPIRCNWNGPCTGGTGIGSASNIAVFNGSSANFEPPLEVSACQQFVICISNYSGVNTLVSFQSLGSASLSCNPNCNPDYTVCYGSTATVVPVNFAGLANPVYSIQPGGMVSSTGSLVVSPTITTTYTTFITGTNSSNVVETKTAVSTVTVYPAPASVPSVTNTTCTNTVNAVNLNLTFNPTGTSASYSIAWEPVPNGISGSAQTSFTGGIAAGPYSATVTTEHGCSTVTNFTVAPTPPPVVIDVIGTNSITCISDATLMAVNPAYNYTWSSTVGNFTGPAGVFTSTMIGTWELLAEDTLYHCVATKTFVISQNIVTPTTAITPSFQVIDCNLSSITTVSATAAPSVNITHHVMAPQGGTFSAQSHTLTYFPGAVGVYTHCAINEVNGCETCTTFTVESNQGFPTFKVNSLQNFTIGCNSTSCAVISIDDAATELGGPASYTVLAPGTSSVTPPGTLSPVNVYTVCAPGNYTVITKDNNSFCETRVPISILSKTLSPEISAIVERQVLDCNNPKVTLKGVSTTPGVEYYWNFVGNPDTQQGDTITAIANTLLASSTQTLVNSYTLVINNLSSTCKSFSTIPIYQNFFRPRTVIAGGGSSLTCLTHSITLTNQSVSNIDPATGFPRNQPVVGFLWEGPSPQVPASNVTSYVARVPGVYTLTAKDLNNGCTSQTTATIIDNRIHPIIEKQTEPEVLDCGSDFKIISAVILNPTSAETFTWITPPGSVVSDANLKDLSVDRAGKYRLTVLNPINGCSAFSEYTVIDGTLTANFDAIPAKGYAPLTVQFYNNSASSSTSNAQASSGIKAYWNFNNGLMAETDVSNLSPTTLYSFPGTYSVTLFVAKGNCLDTMMKYIIVEHASAMEIPNVFTPNGDNVNDLFFVKAANLEEITVLIYDRWGHVVYDVLSHTGNIEWDGKNKNGKDAAEGTYFYIIKSTGKDGKAFEKKGTVSLYR